jgi:tripeptidyl-peptidase-1
MPGIWQFFAIALSVQATFGSPVRTRSPYAVKEKHLLPRGWKGSIKPSRNHIVNLKIGVKQGNFEQLEKDLYEVSDPGHVRYGKHLSHKEVIDLIKPKEDTSNLVHQWLNDCGVDIKNLGYSPAKDWIEVTLPINEVERILETEYQIYEHEDGSRMVRTLEWSLPVHLHEHIDTIQPTTSFLRYSTKNANIRDWDLTPEIPAGYQAPTDPEVSKVCNVTSVTPQCFQALYKTKGYEVQSADENSIAFNNFLGEIPIRPDTVLFAQKYNPDAVGQAESFPQISIKDGPAQDGPLTLNQSLSGISHEANLDVQAILGISDPTPLISYSTGGSPPFIPDAFTTKNTNEPYLDWVNYMLALEDVPNVISTSYGDDEQTVPRDYAVRVCQGFAQLGARGVSLLFASGDNGVGANGSCITNDGTNTPTFLPSFPPSCPYITVVGATHQFEPEVVAYRAARLAPNGTVLATVYSSGGGFGNYFPTPDYQADVVQSYVAKLNGSFDGLYNKSGRAYPDLAAQGQSFAYFWNGTEGTISGTSASTPLMSGIIALVNDALLANGKSPLGFLNPWLYKTGYKGFTDITSGSAVGCEGSGFPALESWDAVTGFGTPIFPELVKLADW